MANLVWGFAKLEIKDGPLFDLLAAKIFFALDPKRQDIPGRALLSSCFSLFFVLMTHASSSYLKGLGTGAG